MLARGEGENEGAFVLRWLMRCLEKEMWAMRNPGFDKTALSEAEALCESGGSSSTHTRSKQLATVICGRPAHSLRSLAPR